MNTQTVICYYLLFISLLFSEDLLYQSTGATEILVFGICHISMLVFYERECLFLMLLSSINKMLHCRVPSVVCLFDVSVYAMYFFIVMIY